MTSADFQAEQAFARTFLNILGHQPVVYPDDYHQPLESSLKRVPVLQIPVPPVPQRKSEEGASAATSVAADSAAINLTFKSLKPALAYTLPVSPTDSILFIKRLLHATYPQTLPPAEHQRILLKGKALADQKLLKEYNVKEGDVVNLVFKAGAAAPTTTTTEKEETPVAAPKSVAASPAMTPPSNPFASTSGSLDPLAKPTGGKRHQRIPSVVLSPSPSNETAGANEPAPKEIMLDIDANTSAPISPVMRDQMLLASTYHDTVAKPEFWARLLQFLSPEFQTESDVHAAFEDFLCATKGSLTANQIARIRDHVGISGMAGT